MATGPSAKRALLRVKVLCLLVMSKFPAAGYHIITELSRPSTVRISRKLAVESRRVRTLNWPLKTLKWQKKPRFASFLKGPEWVAENSNRNQRLRRAPFKHGRMRHPENQGLEAVPPVPWLTQIKA
jgi:hypothetical protein